MLKVQNSSLGLTLVELMLAMAIIGVLAAIAIPSYSHYIEKAKVSRAAMEIAGLQPLIQHHFDDYRDYPDSLADIGAGALLDPWGNPYRYLNLNKKGNGGARRDKNLNPLNSDYDLYSIGKDTKTKLPISQKDSLDDVLRANDGRFIDLAEKY